eukprot:SAG11_NODE_18197_length_497_cov_1.319095_2_plen_43_part_01
MVVTVLTLPHSCRKHGMVLFAPCSQSYACTTPMAENDTEGDSM